MSDSIILECDFTNINPASGGLAVLATGNYKGAIGDVKFFAGENGRAGRLLVYMDTAEGRVRESFDMGSGMPFLLSLMISAGIVKESPNKKVKIDFAKFVGKAVHFHYTAPPPSSGEGDKQYAKFRFMDATAFENEARKTAAPAAATAQAPAVTGRKGAEAAPAAAAATPAPAGDDLDFLG
jgi:hypothetical protein